MNCVSKSISKGKETMAHADVLSPNCKTLLYYIITVVQDTMGTGSFPGVKWPERGADHPPPSKRRGHERVGLYLYSPSGPSWPVIGRTFNFTLIVVQECL